MGTKRTIYLRGSLGERFGERWELDVRTPAEAIRAINANRPGLVDYLRESHEQGVAFVALLDDASLKEDQLHDPFGVGSTFTIMPHVHGASDDPLINILAGIALIAVAVFVPGGIHFAFAGFKAGIGIGAGTFAATGGFLLVSGVSQMIAGTPNTSASDLTLAEAPENVPSTNFNGPVNTVGQGNPVPIGYGRMIIGSQTISVGIDSLAS